MNGRMPELNRKGGSEAYCSPSSLTLIRYLIFRLNEIESGLLIAKIFGIDVFQGEWKSMKVKESKHVLTAADFYPLIVRSHPHLEYFSYSQAFKKLLA